MMIPNLKLEILENGKEGTIQITVMKLEQKLLSALLKMVLHSPRGNTAKN